MKVMNKTDYIDIAIKNKFFNKRLWHTSLFGIHELGFDNEYISVTKEGMLVKVNDITYQLDTYKELSPYLTITDEVVLSADALKSLPKEFKTTLGTVIVNLILVEHPFSGKIEFLKDVGSLDNILNIVKNALGSEVITVAEYRNFVTPCTFLENLSKLYTPSTTKKLMLPPPDIKKVKKELKEALINKHGKDWHKNPANVVAYDTALKEHYSKYIAGDASDGVIANKKHKGNALAKKYLTFSSTNAFGEQVHIDESLMDGYPKDPEKLAAMFNTIRSASYSRGNETQKGGSVAKNVLRSTSSIKIVPGDCGSKIYRATLVTEDNYMNLVGRYTTVGKKIEALTLEDAKKLIGRNIDTRTPMGCRTKKPDYCSVCSGKVAAGYPNGVALIVTNISSILTKAALKAMHNTQISAVNVNVAEIIF